MATPAAPAALAMSAINTELGLGSTTQRNMGSALVRTLAGVPSGAIRFSDLRGKSNRVTVTYVISSNTANGVITLGTTTPTSGTYIAGKSDCTITINSGIYVYGDTSTGDAGVGLTVSGGTAGDTLAINNAGIIMGEGGYGGSGSGSIPQVGGAALNITTTVSGTVAITNTGYIVGGGGGGGGYYQSLNFNHGGGGGGGAGGGTGGRSAWPQWLSISLDGGTGGAVGAAGGNGGWAYQNGTNGFPVNNYNNAMSGGGGGRRLPFTAGGASGGSTGVTGLGTGTGGGGGGAGGGGAGGYRGTKTTFGLSGGGGGFGAAGGSSGSPAALPTSTSANGGSNFANGGSSSGTLQVTGALGGAAVKHVGVTVSVSGGTVWGATT